MIIPNKFSAIYGYKPHMKYKSLNHPSTFMATHQKPNYRNLVILSTIFIFIFPILEIGETLKITSLLYFCISLFDKFRVYFFFFPIN